MKKKRNVFDKLNTLFFGKDLRVTDGEPYTHIREYDFSSYYPEDKYIYNQNLPAHNVVDIRDFGADVNNEDNAEYINAAIDAASKNGSIVLVSGGDYISTAVILKSNVTLFIEKGSSISANESGKGYEPYKALLCAKDAENIKLTGGGKLKGNGHLFGRKPVLDKNMTEPAKYIDVIKMRQDYRAQLRFAHPSKYGGLIHFDHCSDVTVDNFILENSAYWTFKISNSNHIFIENFVINNNRNVANADGIDIAGTSNVKIKHCFISTADDGIVLKNAIWLKNKETMQNISVSDCEIISRTNAIKVGTETTNDISNITIENCSLFMVDLYPGSVSGLSFEACDGTALSDVRVKNITMDRCTCPIFIRLGNRNRASTVTSETSNIIEFGGKFTKGGTVSKNTYNHKSRVKNIVIENITATNIEIPIIIAGYKQNGITNRIENVTLSNIHLEYADIPEIIDKRLFIPEYADVYPEGWRFRNLPAYGMWIRHVKNIKTSNITIKPAPGTWKKEIIKMDVK